jgi:type IV pilus assembly protein PilY1
MQDAADEAGGIYITAYNEGQLNAAFYAIGLAMADAVSFTAPVVSVDAKNKIQNGEDLYMGLFLPLDAGYWPGNLRKFKLGDRSKLRPDLWQIYDAGTSSENDANHATDRYGQFYDNTDGFWGGEDDDNDENTPDMLQIREDGVGEVLTERVEKNFDDANYYSQRNIKTLIGGNLVAFNRDNVSPLDLGLANPDTADAAVTRDKIINWIYGYTFDADATTGTPLAARDWALGAIVHSRPVVIDYLDSSDLSVVDTRYIAIGSDDGMIHIFKDTGINENDLTDHDGTEVFAFVPTEILPQLQQLEDPNLHISLVDGLIKIFRVDGQPKYLFCGLRRGGRSYIRIDISDSDPATWTVDEISSNTISELGQTWSDVILSRVRTGPASYTNVAIFSGGYDDEEDNYPEPFNDEDLNGTPYADNGNLDVGEWKSNNDEQDINGNNLYDISNPSANSMGRGIFVVDIDSTPPALLFSVKYDAASNSPALNTASNVTAQTRTDMPYCFPATPSVVSLPEINETTGLREGSILKVIYAPDIYGNMFRITYDYAEDTKLWQVKKLFSANPGSSSDSGELLQGANTDSGRKVFYGPAVSWRGTGRFFTPSNYYYSNVTFAGTLDIASLFFGTGDRVHPTYQIVRNRMYALYDDIPVSASSSTSGDIDVHSAPYTENNLLNITCDELGINTTQVSGDTYTYKTALETLLRDDVTNPDISAPMEIDDGGNGENDAKGWYIILEDQGNSTYCSHCDYAGTVDDTEGGRDYHVGEKILSKVDLFAGNIYFYSYQPAFDDPCAPEGNAFFYALNYLNGSAALNLNDSNDLSTDELEEGEDPTQKDVTDRYGKIFGVKTIGSGELVSREGEVRIISNIPGSPPLEGASTRQTPYYWIEK